MDIILHAWLPIGEKYPFRRSRKYYDFYRGISTQDHLINNALIMIVCQITLQTCRGRAIILYTIVGKTTKYELSNYNLTLDEMWCRVVHLTRSSYNQNIEYACLSNYTPDWWRKGDTSSDDRQRNSLGYDITLRVIFSGGLVYLHTIILETIYWLWMFVELHSSLVEEGR